ncbi:MAG: hypothetical protein WD598_15180 [Acidimicrobiia bacterium]
MGETPELYAEVANLRDEVEEQGAMLDALVRSSSRRSEILDALDKDEALRAVLLLIDGNRAQNDVVDALRAQGVSGASAATVSRKVDILANELGLVLLSRQHAGGKVYRRTRLERALNIVRTLEREKR